jgi:hypothetical protein
MSFRCRHLARGSSFQNIPLGQPGSEWQTVKWMFEGNFRGRNQPEASLGVHDCAIGQIDDHQCILALNVTPDQLADMSVLHRECRLAVR